MSANPVSLITGIFDAGPGAAAKKSPFELRAGPFKNYELEVISFRGRERVNDVYRYEVTFATQVAQSALQTGVFGAPVCLTLKSPGYASQVIQGLVASLEALGGVSGEQGASYRRYRLEIVPTLWLLKHRRSSQIFQGKTVMQIVAALLEVVGIKDSECKWRTVDKEYPPLPFMYQRNESDYDFFRRVLASAGIFFYFDHATGLLESLSSGGGAPSGATVLNFARRASDTPGVAGPSGKGAPGASADDAPSGTFLFDDGMGADDASECVFEFGLKKRLRTKALQLLERQVDASKNWIGSASETAKGSSEGFDADATSVKASVLQEARYQVDPNLTQTTQDPKSIDNPQMELELARTRRRFLEARGVSDCRRMAAGYRFKLASHPVTALNGEYTLTAVDAEGNNPDFVADAPFVYRNRFRCIPSTYMPIPPRPKKRPKLGLEVAQVVAYKDILKVPWLESSPCGYVKVRFRWDVLDVHGTPAGELKMGTDDAQAIWVPVLQPWAGAGYGAQFIPREGMEVLVGFLEAQGERPVILGCLYSAANPPPWSAQADQQKVGIKSQTRASNGGSSEISIDDTQGKEVVTLQAQKDLTENILNDRTTTIGDDDSLTVTLDRTVSVGQNDSLAVTGNSTRTVGGADTTAILGDSTTTVTGDSTTSITGNVSLSTQGTTTESLTGDVSRTLGGDVDSTTAGVSDHSFADDYTERHLGHRTIIVGSGDAQRTAALHVEGMGRAYASMSFEVEVLQSITLICGNSQILVSPGGITFSSPNISLVSKEVDVDAGTFSATASDALTLAGKTATLETAGAQVALDSSSANVTASQVSLGQGSGALSSDTVAPVKITTVQMKDSQGKPRANARVLLVKGGKGGEQRMTVLDADGMLELIGDTQYSISFPDDPVKK
jgi:type VI secretion system secreted protein VgrG